MRFLWFKFFAAALIVLALLACTSCQEDVVCDQRWRFESTASMADAPGQVCTTVDADDDGYSSWEDSDDRCSDQAVSVVYDPYWCPGRYESDIRDCRLTDSIDGSWTDEYTFGCIVDYRLQELAFLCDAFGRGEWAYFDEVYTNTGQDYWPEEVDGFYRRCPDEDIEAFDALPSETLPEPGEPPE